MSARESCLKRLSRFTRLWHFSKSKVNLKSDRVNLVAPASSIECFLYLTYVRAIQYKLGPEMLTRLGNSNVLRLPVDFTFKGNVQESILLRSCKINFQKFRGTFQEFHFKSLNIFVQGFLKIYLFVYNLPF